MMSALQPTYKRAEDWGDLEVVEIKQGEHFFKLLEELEDDGSEFLGNKRVIATAYKEGNLYGLRVRESDGMFARRARRDPIFCQATSCYMLPVFCVITVTPASVMADIIWTHSRARRNGFARHLVKTLGITQAYEASPESMAFWRACGIDA
jgi:hypothetical protein